MAEEQHQIQVEQHFSQFDIFPQTKEMVMKDNKIMLSSSISYFRPLGLESSTFRGSNIDDNSKPPNKVFSSTPHIKKEPATMTPRGSNTSSIPRNNGRDVISKVYQQQNSFIKKREVVSSPHTTRKKLASNNIVMVEQPARINNFTHGSAHPIIIRQGRNENDLDISMGDNHQFNKGGPTPTSFVNFKSLKQGQTFDQDITNIMAVVDNIEQDFGFEKLNQHFSAKKNKQIEHNENENITKLSNNFMSPSIVKSIRKNHRRNITQFNSNQSANQQSLRNISRKKQSDNEPNSNNFQKSLVIQEGVFNLETPQPGQNTFTETDVRLPLFQCSEPQKKYSQFNLQDFTGTYNKRSQCNDSQSKRIVMQINKVIPAYQLHQRIKKEQLAIFEKDYAAMPLLIDFDKKLIEIYNHRNDRYPHKAIQDEDKQKDLAYQFQLKDIQDLRDLVKTSLMQEEAGRKAIEDKMTEERQFFLRQSAKDKDSIRILQMEKDKFKETLDEQYRYFQGLFIQKEVQKICSKALLKYECEVQQSLLTQPSLHEDHHVTKLKKQKYKTLFKELLHKHESDLKIAEHTIEMLENKISELIAEQTSTQNSNLVTLAHLEESQNTIKQLNSQVQHLTKVRQQSTGAETTRKKQPVTQDSTMMMHLHDYERVRISLDHSQAENEKLKLQYFLLQQDNQTLVSHLTSLKSAILYVTNQMDTQMSLLEKDVSVKLTHMRNKMTAASDTWKEAALYNQEKTHYLEEVSALRSEKDRLKDRNRVLEEKVRVAGMLQQKEKV